MLVIIFFSSISFFILPLMSIFAFLKRKIVVPYSLAKGFVTEPAISRDQLCSGIAVQSSGRKDLPDPDEYSQESLF